MTAEAWINTCAVDGCEQPFEALLLTVHERPFCCVCLEHAAQLGTQLETAGGVKGWAWRLEVEKARGWTALVRDQPIKLYPPA